MSNLNKSNGIIGGVFWKFGERITAQLVSTVVAIILARILMPEDYGLVSVVMIFITFFNAFVVGGLGNALIQKKNADNLDFSSLFYVSILLSFTLYCVLFVLATPLAKYYEEPMMIPLLRVMGIRIPIAAYNSIQQAYISKKMQFKKFFFATLSGTIVSAIVGIYLALAGKGPWALVAQYLTNVLIDTVFLSFICDWRPSRNFSIERVKLMLPFGLKMMGSTLLDTLFNEIRSIVISKKYSMTDLAVYDNGRKYPNLISDNINASIGSVIFPALANIQGNTSEFKTIMKKSIKMSVFILAPLIMGLFAVADRFVTVILTEKWIASVPYIRLTCVMCLLYPVHTINIQALNAIGESGRTLKLEVIKKILNVSVLLISMFYGVMAIAVGATIVSLTSTWINSVYAKKFFNYSFFKQMLDVLKPLFASVAMTAFVMIFDSYLSGNGVIALFLDIMVGAILYIAFSYIFKIQELDYLASKLKSIIRC